jgi:N-acylneuraminate cytidylyltransferase
MKRVALIPARGGSKRIPRKNIKKFLGKPIIAYSIKVAIESQLFDDVIVSTDDEEIAEIALEYGASVPFFRPSVISDDHATTVDVIKHAIEWLSNSGFSYDVICCLYATAPFIKTSSLIKGLTAIEDNGFLYSFVATEFSFPIQRAIKRNADGGVAMFYAQHLKTRSQDLEAAYHDAGQFYWGRTQAFLQDVPLFNESAYSVLVPHNEVQDIDTESDWQRAEFLYKYLNK